MKVKAIAINLLARQLINGVAFEQAKRIVTDLDDKDISNDDKRKIAVETLKAFGYALAGFLANLAIELAVAWLRSKAED